MRTNLRLKIGQWASGSYLEERQLQATDNLRATQRLKNLLRRFAASFSIGWNHSRRTRSCDVIRPDWLGEDRGPDISPYFNWYPIITTLQLAFDLPLASSVPLGYGHNFAADSYIDAWLEVTEPIDWSDVDINRLKSHIAVKNQKSDSK